MAAPTSSNSSMSLSDMFRSTIGIRKLSAAEITAIGAVANFEEYTSEKETNDMGFLDLLSTEAWTDAEGVNRPPSALQLGSVIGFPMNPDFHWASWNTSSWHMFEVMRSGSDGYDLASCGALGGAAAVAIPGCFSAPTEDQISLPFTPSAVVVLRNPDNFTRARRERDAVKEATREDALAPVGGKRGTATVSGKRRREPLGEEGRGKEGDEGEDDGEDSDRGRGGLKTDRDDDGHIRVYRTTASSDHMKEWRVIYRTTSVIKQQILTVGQSLEEDVWVNAMRFFRGRDMPEGMEPEMQTFYLLDIIKDCRAIDGDKAVVWDAVRMVWKENNWTAMSVMYFHRDPSAGANITLAGNSSTHVRTLLADAVEGWRFYQTVHRDSRYATCLSALITWLRQTNVRNKDKQEGVRLRHAIETMFFEYSAAITRGGTRTQYPGIEFSQSDAHLTLLTAMETELLERTLPDDPYPHVHFQDWRKSHTIIGAAAPKRSIPAPSLSPTSAAPAPPSSHQETPKQAVARPAAASPSTGSTSVQSQAETKGTYPICGWHVGEVLRCADSTNLEMKCFFGVERCKSAHDPLAEHTAKAVKSSCHLQFGEGIIYKRITEAVDRNPGLFKK